MGITQERGTSCQLEGCRQRPSPVREMRPWRRVAGALKDRNSIWIVTFSRRTGHRNPDLEPLIIKATSHDESRLDYKHVQRVYKWLNISPLYLKSFMWGLTMRLQKTRCWVVALKGLILIHGVLCANVPGAHRIGRLPFDLSNFTDAYSDPDKIWGYNAFVRTYFAYLDKRSSFVSYEVMKKKAETVMDELERLQKLQGLLDTLLQIKPQIETMRVRNILIEAMDPVLLDIFYVYSIFCDGMAKALVRIYEEGGKLEASSGLKVLQKAVSQSDELSNHLEFCRDIGVLTASQCPRVDRIPEEDVQELKRIINGVPRKQNKVNGDHDHQNGITVNNDKAIVVRHSMEIVEKKEASRRMVTVVTDKWEVFDEDMARGTHTIGKPFVTTISLIPPWHSDNHVLPDLISL